MSGKIVMETGALPVTPIAETLAGLEALIAEVDVVSFDLFDTLFVRPLTDPEDLFDIIGARYGIDDFRARRRTAQIEAFRRMHEVGLAEIDLDGIYRCFGPLPVPAQTLHQAEYDLELQLTVPNPEMTAVFRRALSLGKRVVIASDMYLPLAFFESLLDLHGLDRVPLFISSARNATKRDHGDLFDLIADEMGVRHERILHIGDNAVSDEQRAAEKGLRTWLYKEERVPPRRKGISPAASLARGLVRIHQSEVEPGSLQELGFLRGGPAALGFLDWIAAKARRDQIDHILFVSRDGHVLVELAKEYLKAKLEPTLPRFSYLLGSRVSFSLAGMDEGNFDTYLPFLVSGAKDLSPRELLERIGVPPPAEAVMRDLDLGSDVRLGGQASATVLGLLFALKWEILKVCRANRRGLLRHLLALGVNPGQRVAFVDIGWNGTTQEAFENVVRELIPIDVFGYYFCLTDSADCRRRRKSMRMEAVVDPNSVPGTLLEAVYANRVAGEILFSAPHDPVIGYRDDSHGVTAIEDPGRADAGDIAACTTEIEQGIIDFARRFVAHRIALGLAPDPLGMAMPMLEFMADGRWAEHPRLRRIKNFDSWASSRNRDMWLWQYART
ncbi:MAG: hydrolase [Burkholderiaceae bacterium]